MTQSATAPCRFSLQRLNQLAHNLELRSAMAIDRGEAAVETFREILVEVDCLSQWLRKAEGPLP